MLKCPFCNTETSDTALQQGRCPSCGGIIIWDQASADDPLAVADTPGPPPQEPVPEDEEPDGELVRGTIHPSGPATPAASDPRPPEIGSGTLPASAAPRELSDRDMKTLEYGWKPALRDDLGLNQTLKADSRTTVRALRLVIQPRKLVSPEVSEDGRADYELREMIGEGGVGVVYSARQASIDRQVAIKMLRPELADDSLQREKFLSEAVVTGELDHPNIVPIHDLGTSADGQLFYSMKLVRGTPWLKVMRQKSLHENLNILLKVCDAIAFAHARGVIHRDIKPENVMLGDFGEVLVMDWGIALSTSLFLKDEAITQSASMGGTPAYMAPEMATGPLDQIGPASDVYLLGAVLFEIVTGKPPHRGKDVMDCLFAAARNQIEPTDESGELLEIAYWAMATKPADRPPSVKAFQDAIRTYLEHAESITLVTRAEDDLKKAQQEGDYQLFARARFGFEEALMLWNGNHAARHGLSTSSLKYAQCALTKGDYDLGLSLLSPDDPRHVPLREQLQLAQRERNARQERLKSARRLAAALAACFLIAVTTFVIILYFKNSELARAKRTADEGWAEARHNLEQAKLNKEEADKKAEEADNNARIARASESRALRAEAEAKQDRDRALAEKERAVYAEYLAQIGLAEARLAENAFYEASDILETYADSHLRHWEWARLKYLNQLAARTIELEAAADAVAYAPDGDRFAVGRQAGGDSSAVVQIWQSDEPTTPEHVLPTGGYRIFDVAFSPDGRYVAAVTDAEDDYVQLWDAQTGQRVARSFQGHTDWVLSVEFSADGELLLTSSFDKTAIVWDVPTGALLRRLQRHHGPVWDAAMSPDRRTVVTAAEDGTVIVWSDADGTWRRGDTGSLNLPKFRRHAGPVYCVAFSPDGKYVASGGADQSIYVWDPASIRAFPYSQVLTRQTGASEPAPNVVVEQAQWQPSVALQGHTRAVRSIAFASVPSSSGAASGGLRLVSGSDDNTVRIWEPLTGRSLSVLRGHSRSVRACDFGHGSHEGFVISAGHDQQVKFWQYSRYAEFQVLRGHSDAVLSARFSEEGNSIVTAGRDETARVWYLEGSGARPSVDVVDLKTLQEGHEFLASRAMFYRQGQRLLTAAMDSSVRFWNPHTGTETGVIQGTGQNAAVAVSDDGRWLLSGSPTRDGILWRLTEDGQGNISGQQEAVLPADENGAAITSVAILSGEVPRLVLGDQDGWCSLWVRDSQVRQVKRWRAHTEGIVAIAFTPDGQQFLTASRDGTIRAWSSRNATEVVQSMMQHPKPVLHMALSSDGRLLASACADGVVRLWNPRSGTELRSLVWSASSLDTLNREGLHFTIAGNIRRRMSDMGWNDETLAAQLNVEPTVVARARRGALGREDADLLERIAALLGTTLDQLQRPLVNWVDLSSDGSRLLTTSSEDRSLHLWDTRSGREVTSSDAQAAQGIVRQMGPSVAAAIFSPDPSQLLLIGGRSARLLDMESGRVVKRFRPHDAIPTAAFSPNGQFVVTGSWDSSAKVWNVQTRRAQWRLEAPEIEDPSLAAINTAVFTPDGRYIVTGSDDRKIRIWRPPVDEDQAEQSGLLVATIESGHGGPVRYVTFSPDGTYLITVSDDATGRLWRVVQDGDDISLEFLTELVGHTDAVLCAAFSEDGWWVATGGRDQSARIWEVPTGKQLGILRGHTDAVNAVAFSPDRHRLLTGSADQTAKLWALRIAGDGRGLVIGRQVLSLHAHQDAITAVAFSPNGQHILTAGADATTIVWKADETEPLVHFSLPVRNWEQTNNPGAVDPRAEVNAFTSGTLAGATMSVEIVETTEPLDRLELETQTPEPELTVLFAIQDGTLRYWRPASAQWTTIGTMVRSNDGRKLEFHFNDQVSVPIVQGVLRSVKYDPTSMSNMLQPRTIRCQLTDGMGRTSPPAEIQIVPAPPAEVP